MKAKLETWIMGFLLSLTVLFTVLANQTHADTVQVGMASWYGPYHHGRLMANGKRFNMYANTVAHKTLPLGTVVQVKNVETGKTVVATVTDRGPYAKKRILDMSKGVASKLGLIKSGVGKIELTVLSRPEPKSKRKGQPRQPQVSDVEPLVDSAIKNNYTEDSIETLLADMNIVDRQIDPLQPADLIVQQQHKILLGELNVLRNNPYDNATNR